MSACIDKRIWKINAVGLAGLLFTAARVLDKTAIKLSIHSSSSGNSSTVYHMLTKLVANQNRHPLLAFLW